MLPVSLAIPTGNQEVLFYSYFFPYRMLQRTAPQSVQLLLTWALFSLIQALISTEK